MRTRGVILIMLAILGFGWAQYHMANVNPSHVRTQVADALEGGVVMSYRLTHAALEPTTRQIIYSLPSLKDHGDILEEELASALRP